MANGLCGQGMTRFGRGSGTSPVRHDGEVRRRSTDNGTGGDDMDEL
jgi:hypothetical protein